MGSVFGSKDGLRPSTSTPMTDSLTSSLRPSSAASTTNRRNRLPRSASAKVALPRICWSCTRTGSRSMVGKSYHSLRDLALLEGKHNSEGIVGDREVGSRVASLNLLSDG